ncbi:helix-turn-helix transcriptional regulator [Xanthobacteraceae bacterium Astr-EGSB]|uniref:ArsR/SmtB family transcription factor n=1 Tax=Astrobacterium formosum TaxID=3069710 RepID=UPI0027B6E304|nr:helix-turn-helix transcriptional regulator [Xanthobacteraceae bacterium Astr-EGSB]
MKSMRALPQPDLAQLDLANVLEALSDPTRLAIVSRLAAGDEPEVRCGTFLDLGSKTNLAYHLGKLRSAGVVSTRISGTSRFMSLRRADLDARFPGLLDAVVASARRPAKAATRRRRAAAAG